ncbi:G protein-coupled receptor 161 [Elysia marginata]|uniref:G protein-coupled receptor 161 n=1 Tax=Elysia marginata TaxID=1093978 RepID=A0AAV4F627_9GAST|nr:G protein-coupled receptor 161 [Elysia marginata]
MTDDIMTTEPTLTNSSHLGLLSMLTTYGTCSNATATPSCNAPSSQDARGGVTDGRAYFTGAMAYVEIGGFILINLIDSDDDDEEEEEDDDGDDDHGNDSDDDDDDNDGDDGDDDDDGGDEDNDDDDDDDDNDVLPIVTATRWLRLWPLKDAACDFIAVVNHFCTCASLFSLVAIAVNRCVITRQPGRYPDLFSQSRCALYISIIWFFALLYALLPVFGWGAIEYDERRFVCMFR